MSGMQVDQRFRQASTTSARDVLREIDDRHRQRLQEIEERRQQRNTEPSAPSADENDEIIEGQPRDESFWPAPRISVFNSQQSIFNASDFPPLQSNRHPQSRFYDASQVSTPQPLQPQVTRQSDSEIIGLSRNNQTRTDRNRRAEGVFSQAQLTRPQRLPSSQFPAVNEILQNIDERHRQRVQEIEERRQQRNVEPSAPSVDGNESTALLNRWPLSSPRAVPDNRGNDLGFSSAVTSRAPRSTSSYPVVREILQTIDERQNQRLAAASRFGQQVRPSAPSNCELLDLPPSFISVTQIGFADVPSGGRFVHQVIDDLPPSYEEAIRNMN